MWLAVTFGTLATVIVVARIDLAIEPWETWQQTFLVVLIGLFPYFMFRFSGTFKKFPTVVEIVASTLTAGVVAGAFVVDLPAQDAPPATSVQLYIYLILIQWVALLGTVSVRLWLGGRGQPAIAKRRMQTLALGAFGLAIALLLAVVVPSEDAGGVSIAIQALTVGAALLFIAGFTPPRALITIWRRPDEIDLREAEKGLMRVFTTEEIAEEILPHAARIVGGEAAVLADRNNEVMGYFRIDEEQARELLQDSAHETSEVLIAANIISVPLENGRLIVKGNPYTPFFGREEVELLEVLAGLTDLALVRGEQAAQLEAATQAMRDFVAIASHELRTPISLVKGFARTLQDQSNRLDQSQVDTFLGKIETHADRLSKLVDDLLTISRIESGVLHAEPENVDVRRALSEALDDLPDLKRSIKVNVEPGLTVRADRDHFRRILHNYLENAEKYGERPVEVNAAGEGNSVVIEVEDSGPGLAPDYVPKLFLKFSPAKSRNGRVQRGTGLGLSIVKGLAEQDGGQAWYRPKQPKGSIFGVRLPKGG